MNSWEANAKKRATARESLGAASLVVAIPWGISFFFIWAYAGSDAYINIAVEIVGPLIATIAIFANRFLLGSISYLMVAIAEVLRPLIDTNDSFLVSGLIALLPLLLASVSAYLGYRHQ